jgi:hypothetical protein
MIKPSVRWCACIAISLLPAYALAADPTTAAQDAAGAVLQQFGSVDGIRENASLPLTSDSAQLSTIDGTDSAAVQISNPSSNAFLSVSIQKAATGDLMPVRVTQDLNFDGVFDYAYQVPSPASGICANGIISCDAGTWDNCQGYTWSADATARATLQSVPMNQMAGCYCVNQSCGGNNNSEAMLKDLGGAVAGVVQQQKGGYAISRVELNASTISYYGQDSSGSPTGTVAQTAYFSDPGSISGDAYTEVANQAGNPDSYYTMMTTSFSGKGSNTGVQSCSISREVSLQEVSLSDIITPAGGTGAVQICGTDCIRLILGRQGDNYWSGYCSIYEENYKVYVNKPDLIRSATLMRAIWDDYIQVWIGGTKVYNGPNANFPPETGGACELSTSWNVNPNKDVTQYFQQAGLVDTKIRVSVAGGGEGYAFVEVRVNNLCQTLDDVITDNCSALEADSNCDLQEEFVDGVQTYRSFNPTSNDPLPSTRTISASASCSKNITRDWWEKERTYRCTSNNAFDFSDAARRVDTITGTLDGNDLGQSTFDFTDARQDTETGTWTTDDQTVEINPVDPPPDCEFVCKTRKLVQDTQAAVTGVSTDYQNTPARYDTFYHVCGLDNSCPAGPGEEIVEDCQCLDEFAEAASVMMVLDEASRDMMCLDGGTTATGDCVGEIKIFNGKGNECLQNGWDTTFFNCCNDSVGSWLFFKEHCPDASLETVQAKQAGRAHYIGTYCKRDLPLIGCVQEAEVYCLFNSKMGRIIHEQGRVQLQQFNPNGNWGSAGAPNCEGLTPEAFQMLDFSEIDLSEMFGDIAPLPAAQMQNDVQGAINDFQNRVQ